MFKARYLSTFKQFSAPGLADLSSGFYVFLLALPLSLGIAEASGFPAVMGLLTAAVGGLFTSWFTGSKLSIKGPAAGLIVIVLGAVTELGAHDTHSAWIWTLGAIFVAALLQVLMGVLRWGKYVDKVPASAIQGMLAAIGVVILSKQIYILLGMPTTNALGNSVSKPLALLANLGYAIGSIQWEVALIGIWSLLVVWGWTLVKLPWIKAIPSPLVVLITVIPLANILDLSLMYRLRFNFEFSELWQFKIPLEGPTSWWLFAKYVGLFAIIGSLESLLTVNALQGLRPDIKPDKDKDLIAVGLGNMLASAFGGLPMISEVARSSANIHNGAKTHWANFFHGLFILLFMVFSSFFNEMIPLGALAAMLVTVGIRLANPKVLIGLKSAGIEHISGFLATLIGCLAIDLLWGLALGTLAQMGVARLMQIKKD